MDDNSFKMCADCTNKRSIDVDGKGRERYYCALVDGKIPKGIVYDSTDASECIRLGLFNLNLSLETDNQQWDCNLLKKFE